MPWDDLHSWQWILGIIAGLLVGCAKTGLPGIGILVVPLMATAFGGRASVGALLPMLIIADCFAVAFYRRHAEWDKLVKLVPWVAVGLSIGFLVMWWLGSLEAAQAAKDDVFKPVLGGLILCMLGLLLLRRKFGDRLTPQSRLGVMGTGVATGSATFLANAAGPVMTLYLAAMGMPKERFMGTNAWFFLLVNITKIPMFLLLGLLVPQAPLITASSFVFNLMMAPVIIIGVFIGAWVFKRIPQKIFDAAVLLLAAAAAVNLIIDALI